MPNYAWTCQVCSGGNDPGIEICPTCNSPAQLSAVDINRLRHSMFPERTTEPLHGPIYLFLSKPSGWLPASYALVASVTLGQAGVCGGDMCALSAIVPGVLLLPWSILSFLSASLGTALSHGILIVGLVVNTCGLYAIGKRLE